MLNSHLSKTILDAERSAAPQQKTPLRGGGALLGLLQGGEIYVSLYMWIRGR
jgi:hypothetical protein